MKQVRQRRAAGTVLALDTASPVVSVAAARGETLLASRRIELARSSEHLLALIEETLTEASERLRDLEGLVVLRGPGSFTGLRIGLATVLAFHQTLGLPAAAPSTLSVLAADAEPRPGERCFAVVDALRREWIVQELDPRDPSHELSQPQRVSEERLLELPSSVVSGFGLEQFAARDWPARLRRHHPTALAPAAARLAPHWSWNTEDLTRPLYFRPPAVTTR